MENAVRSFRRRHSFADVHMDCECACEWFGTHYRNNIVHVRAFISTARTNLNEKRENRLDALVELQPLAHSIRIAHRASTSNTKIIITVRAKGEMFNDNNRRRHRRRSRCRHVIHAPIIIAVVAFSSCCCCCCSDICILTFWPNTAEN